MPTELRVLLADDHAVVREGLKAMIDAQPDMHVVGEASDGLTALALAHKSAPNLAILDCSMPGLSGAQLASRLRDECPQVQVLGLSVHEDKSYLRQMMESGAKGYVLKRAIPDELINAMRKVAAGGVYLDPQITDRAIEDYIGSPAHPDAPEVKLSDRETEVLKAIALGHTNREIAEMLQISIKTVETHKSRMTDKLGLQSRAQIVRYAIRRGWLTG